MNKLKRRWKVLVFKIKLTLLGGDYYMMAFLFTQRVILGKTEFKDIPSTLQPAVYEQLVDSGVEFLAGDYIVPEKV